MKCTSCNKEFGSGSNCQNCGIDRVTGLGQYNGYRNPHSRSGHPDSLTATPSVESPHPQQSVCHFCSEVIPSDAKYCPYCRKQLVDECPECGHVYSTQYPNCPQCGTNKKEYKKEEERIRKLENDRKRNEERKKEKIKHLKNIANRYCEEFYNKERCRFIPGWLVMLIAIVLFIIAVNKSSTYETIVRLLCSAASISSFFLWYYVINLNLKRRDSYNDKLISFVSKGVESEINEESELLDLWRKEAIHGVRQHWKVKYASWIFKND